MNILLTFVTLTGIACAHAQEKGNSIIPFPRVGRAGNVLSPGLIPFPRVGRDGGMHEVKRQLIPFPRVGKRVPLMWPVGMGMPIYMDPYYNNAAAAELEAAQYAPWLVDPESPAFVGDKVADDNNLEVDKKNVANSGGGGMWFGPRLGKRKKRSIEPASESSSEHSRDTLDTRTLVKILHNFNWAIVPVKERRTFTPRLGRSSGEISVHNRAQPLTPRLGRSHEVVPAELEVDDDARYTRSEEHSHGKGTVRPPGDPYSPRLGRADHYSNRRDDRE